MAKIFARSGRLQIEDFLAPECALQLRDDLIVSDRWRRLFNSGERIYELSYNDWTSLSPLRRATVLDAIHEAAAHDFQYQYDTIRVADDENARAASRTLLDRFAEFLCSAPVLETMMRLTGDRELAFADCQATRYQPGDFLTPHNDEVEGMNRRFAYVLSLCDLWLPRWGGLLQFVDSSGGVEETITPRFNALSLFSVGQSHLVSQVSSYAPAPRISVTGWLRTQAPA